MPKCGRKGGQYPQYPGGFGGGGGWSTFSRPLHVVYQKWVSFKLQELKKARPCRAQGERKIDMIIAEPKITGSVCQKCMGPEMLCRQTFHVINKQGSQVDRVQGLLPWHANHSLFLNSEAGSQQRRPQAGDGGG
jgi:hypothetical protein